MYFKRSLLIYKIFLSEGKKKSRSDFHFKNVWLHLAVIWL